MNYKHKVNSEKTRVIGFLMFQEVGVKIKMQQQLFAGIRFCGESCGTFYYILACIHLNRKRVGGLSLSSVKIICSLMFLLYIASALDRVPSYLLSASIFVLQARCNAPALLQFGASQVLVHQ
ncbi:hypothetical protein NE237_008593 [Protea cynaroides]|uniref:Uncharacterized protein n=1 Tax=Protea cynaroides TaxID=273540 RepID=A0A9Q0KVU4_9MAGN|nr:hypothetical protein NE237_008593 [Protea cynaroides]